MIRRIAILSAHTSPLEQPGVGDAGGMNVYVLELSRQLVSRGVDVEIFTRATSRHQPPMHVRDDGVVVHHVSAGPFEGLTKEDLPAQLCGFVRDVLRTEVERGPHHFDAIHSHYWLSGQVGTVAAERWGVPLIHSMHTMAKVKNAKLADGDRAEPNGRIAGEQEIVRLANRLIANTEQERRELIDLYGADPQKTEVVYPGVDLSVFHPTDQQVARARIGVDPRHQLILFAGRIQPLKAPDVLVRAVHDLLRREPKRRETVRLAIIGGASGTGLDRPAALTDLTRELHVDDVVTFVPPMSQSELATWYAAADIMVVPSYSESFGLVAVEAQACGTPVIAAHVGGLSTAVADGVTGTLIDGHNPSDYADAIARLLDDPVLRREMGTKAVEHAAGFGWDVTAERTLNIYEQALLGHQAHDQGASA